LSLPARSHSSRGANETSSLEWIGDLAFSVGQTPQVWLDHQVFELGSELVFNWDSVDDLFPPGMIAEMFEEYRSLITRLAIDDSAWSDLSSPQSASPSIEASSADTFARSKNSANRQVTLAKLSDVLSCLRALERDEFAIAKFRYPSAGSLYPVQTYLHIPTGEFAEVEAGCYYYHPYDHELIRIAPASSLEASTSTQSETGVGAEILLVSESRAIKPMYGELARDFGFLEAGYMCRLLESECRRHGLKATVGQSERKKLEQLLMLGESQQIVQCLQLSHLAVDVIDAE
jgi:SagB-type dehydrogenase family enzyme